MDLAPVVGLVVVKMAEAKGQGQAHGCAVGGGIGEQAGQRGRIEVAGIGLGPVFFNAAGGGQFRQPGVGHGIEAGDGFALAGEAIEPQPVGQNQMVGDSDNGAEIDGRDSGKLLGRERGHGGGEPGVGPAVIQSLGAEEVFHGATPLQVCLFSWPKNLLGNIY